MIDLYDIYIYELHNYNKKNGETHWVGECLGWFGMWTDSASAEATPFVQENKHGALVIVTWDKFFFEGISRGMLSGMGRTPHII